MGTVPLPAESPLGTMPGSGAGGLELSWVRVDNGDRGKGSGCGDSLQHQNGSRQPHSNWFWFRSDVRQTEYRQISGSGSGCLSVRASAVPCAADASPAALCGVDSGASHTTVLPLFVFEIESHKAANHILLWVKELSK